MNDGPNNKPLSTGWLLVIVLAAIAAMFGASLLPVLPVTYVQVLAMAATLAAATTFGLWTGLSAATVGFAILLWRNFQSAGSLTLEALVGSFLWFAVAKLAAALISVQRTRVTRRDAALLKSEITATRNQLLLAEIRHRTRNDMQRLVAILNSEARGAPQAAEALHSAASHVIVMSRLHERLALRGSDSGVDTNLFLQELADDLRSVIEPDRAIALVADAERHEITASMAADLGLILNELVTNALKHGFPDTTKGIIRLSFRRAGDMFELIVSDNGIGADAAPTKRGSGQSLLHALAGQLGGRLSIDRADVGGTRCQLTFPITGRKRPYDFTETEDEFTAHDHEMEKSRQAS